MRFGQNKQRNQREQEIDVQINEIVRVKRTDSVPWFYFHPYVKEEKAMMFIHIYTGYFLHVRRLLDNYKTNRQQ